jgi:plasmid stability protein
MFNGSVNITYDSEMAVKCMATLYELELPDDLYEHLQKLAQAENSSIEAQAIAILQSVVPTKTAKPIKEILTESRNRRRLNPADFGLADSTELIREDQARCVLL